MMNDRQKDLLKEYLNVYIGKAANMLSEMANQHVILSVPEVEIVNMADETEENQRPLFDSGYIVSSSMKFGLDFSGRALLIFPAQKVKKLVDACLGIDLETSTIDYESTEYNLKNSDFDVLKEISNVILNSIIGEFSNLLETTVDFTVPDIELVYVSENEQKLYLKNSVYMLVLYTNFTLSEAKFDGVIIVALGMNSLKMLLSKIDEVLGKTL